MEAAEEVFGETEFENGPDRNESEDDDFITKLTSILGGAIIFL